MLVECLLTFVPLSTRRRDWDNLGKAVVVLTALFCRYQKKIIIEIYYRWDKDKSTYQFYSFISPIPHNNASHTSKSPQADR